MIEAWHLIWVIPLSMIVGAIGIICYACIVVSKEADKEYERLKEITEGS